MSKLDRFDNRGAAAGQVEIPDDLIVLDRGDQAVHEAIVRYQARRRAGTASTRNKSEVAGTGAKPWRQKGTGRARAGYRQSNVWRGGYAAFGPKPRVYGGKINRKVARLAFQRALSERVAAGQVRVVDDIALEEPKTRHFVAFLKALEVKGPALVIVDRVDEPLGRATRNVPRVEVVSAADVNVYQLLRYTNVIVTAAALELLKERLGAPSTAGGAA